MGVPDFEIPARPERHFPSAGGVEYRGGSVFELAPAGDTAGSRSPEGLDLSAAVDEVLEGGPYQYREFGELPMPLWLVRDRETTDAFRVAVRDGAVRLHVLPATEPAGLRAFYRRLRALDAVPEEWTVTAASKE
jgi:hypothetical protein